MGLKTLDDDRRNPLLTFIEEKLFARLALIVYKGNSANIHSTITRATYCFDLLQGALGKGESSCRVLRCSAGNNPQLTGGIDKFASVGESIDGLMNSAIPPYNDDQFCSLHDRGASGLSRIQRFGRCEHSHLTLEALSQLLHNSLVPPGSLPS
jgi:hypothetical protein